MAFQIQLLSDLHLESQADAAREVCRPLPGIDLTVLAGDIDGTWQGLRHFAGWPNPIVMVAGNHEFDRRDLVRDLPALRAEADRHGIRLLEQESLVMAAPDGRKIRLVGCTRWSDFDVFGPELKPKAMRAARWLLNHMQAQCDGLPLDAEALAAHAQASRRWLEQELALPPRGAWDATVVITHHAPSLRCADPRYGTQPSTAAFCNQDDDLLARADLWLHGHLHSRHDLRPAPGACRVVAHPLGLIAKGESGGWTAEGCRVRLGGAGAGCDTSALASAVPPSNPKGSPR